MERVILVHYFGFLPVFFTMQSAANLVDVCLEVSGHVGLTVCHLLLEAMEGISSINIDCAVHHVQK